MKKIVFILIVILLTLVSCKKEQCNFPKSFICDIANDGIVKETEVDYWNGKSRINDAVDEHKTVKIDNSDISLVYDSSFTGNYWPCEVDRYYSSDDKYTVFFRTDNNQIAMYSLTSWTSYVDDFRIDPINNIEARVVADDIAKNYINIDEYVVSEKTENVQFFEGDGYCNYSFDYTRYINNMPTADKVNIILSNNGKVISLGWTNAGLFNGIKSIELNTKDIDSSVKNKISALYGEKYDYNYEYQFRVLTYTPKGELAVVTAVKLDLEPHPQNNLAKITTGLVLVTIIDNV